MNTGDTAWVLVSSTLVLFMTPGLAFFYGGMARRKNVLSVLMQCFFIMCLIGVQWVVYGYSLTFSSDLHGVIGSLDWTFLKGVSITPYDDYSKTIPHLAFMIFQCMFAVITPALMIGAFAERIKFSAFAIFTLLWATLVYNPIAHWVWGNGGWLKIWEPLISQGELLFMSVRESRHLWFAFSLARGLATKGHPSPLITSR